MLSCENLLSQCLLSLVASLGAVVAALVALVKSYRVQRAVEAALFPKAEKEKKES